MLISYDSSKKSFGGLFDSITKLKEMPKVTDDVKVALNKLEPGMITTSNNFKGLAKHLGTTDKSFISFMSGLKDGSITLKDGQTYLSAYESYLKSTGKTASWATIKTKALSASMKVLSSIGWMVAITAVSEGIKWLGNVIDSAITTTEEYEEKLESLKQEYSEIKSELEGVNSELDTARQRMEELEKKDSLTFTEKEEYDNLAKINNELERENDLLEHQLELKNKEKNDTFIDTMNSDSRGEVNITDENGDFVKLTDKDYLAYYDNVAIVGYEAAKTRGDKESADTYEQIMMDRYEEYAKRAEGISYIPEPSTEDEKRVNEWLDFIEDYQDRMMISLGENGAKTNAFERLVDNWYFDDTVQELQDLGKQGKVTAEMLNDPKYDEFIQKLVDLGVVDSVDDLDDIALAFNNVEESAKGAYNSINKISVSDTISQLSTRLEPAMNSLADAYKNIFTEDGFTLDNVDISMVENLKSELEELSKLGVSVDMGLYENFVKVLSDSSSTADEVQKSFNEMATSILSNFTDIADLDVVSTMLESLGVVNHEIVAFDKLIKNTDALKQAGLDLATATDYDIQKFVEANISAENYAQALNLLKIQKILCNDNWINSSKDINDLYALAKAAGIATDTIAQLSGLKIAYDANEGNELAQRAIAAQMHNLKASVEAEFAELGEVNFDGMDIMMKDTFLLRVKVKPEGLQRRLASISMTYVLVVVLLPKVAIR